MSWSSIANFFSTMLRSLVTPVGLAILTLGFVAGLTPYLTTMTQQPRVQEDMSSTMAQLLQTLLPIMLIMMMFRMMFTSFATVGGV